MSHTYDRPTRFLIRGILVTWLVTKLLSYRLWLSDRPFPVLPALSVFEPVPAWVHSGLLWMALLLLTVSMLFPEKKLLMALVLLETASCLLDQNRWQPWEYFFVFLIAAAAFLRETNALKSAWITLLSGLYFFSGLYKINNGFIHDVWQQLVLHRWLHIGTSNSWLLRLGYTLGFIEMLAGLGLLIPVFRKQSAILLMIMHAWILWLIGPLGLHQNSVVWPWNGLLIVLLYALFFRSNGLVWQSPFRFAVGRFILLCWWILPMLYPFGYWDRYFSGALYSGGVAQLYICNNGTPIPGTQHAIARKINGISCEQPVSYYKWCMQELNVVPVEETRTYRAAIQQLQMQYPQLRFFMVKHGFQTDVQEWK
ncbi:MAG TPA: hypothetical protein PKK69_06010 [Ferruginibacter sp.]|nr:hypothetical protein [Ferruginibacter sp.]